MTTKTRAQTKAARASLAHKWQNPFPAGVPETPDAVRAASDLLAEALSGELEAKRRADEAEAALRVAEHNDTAAQAAAVRAGSAEPPKLTAPGAAQDLAAVRNALEVRRQIVADAQRDLAYAVREHRDGWVATLRATTDSRLERVRRLLDELDAALIELASAGHTVARLEAFDGRTVDLRAVTTLGDNGSAIADSATLLEAIETLASEACGEQVDGSSLAIKTRAKERRRAAAKGRPIPRASA